MYCVYVSCTAFVTILACMDFMYICMYVCKYVITTTGRVSESLSRTDDGGD